MRERRDSGLIPALGHRSPQAARQVEAKPLGEALVFMRALWAVAHALESASKRMHARFGITGPQRLVLRLIGHRGRISAGELAQMLHVHPSSLTGILQRLEQAELIRRESDPFDRRRALFELTRRGEQHNQQREGTIEARVEETLQKLSPERIAATKAVLTAIAAALEDAPEPPARAAPKAAGKRVKRAPRRTV